MEGNPMVLIIMIVFLLFTALPLLLARRSEGSGDKGLAVIKLIGVVLAVFVLVVTVSRLGAQTDGDDVAFSLWKVLRSFLY